VQLDPVAYGRPGPLHGTVVSPSLVTERDGTYWGYTVRLASSIKAVFDECPYEEGTYDLTIGTSERGNETVDDARFSLRNSKQRHNNPIATATSNTNTNNATYRHALIVFGGVAGIEECVDADESLKLAGSASSTMFDKWINICPFQGSRTIRSEEAVLIALAKLSPFLAEAACKAAAKPKQESASQLDTSAAIHLTDEVSDESSDDDRADNDEGDE
jgi:methyltransferase